MDVTLNRGRDARIDLLRCMGLFMVMLAHVYPPAWLAQLRNFDVPLMVVVSALSFGASYKAEAYSSYVWARIKRLVFPVWLFLTLLFLVQFLCAFPQELPEFTKIWRSYLMLDQSIGYVWVIRVFLLVALAAPLLWRWQSRIEDLSRYLIGLTLSYIAYELCVTFVLPTTQGLLRSVLTDWLFYLWPYALVFAFALKLPQFTRLQTNVAITLFALITMGLTSWQFVDSGHFVLTQKFKYPPQHYYLAYALFISVLLYRFADVLLQIIARARLMGIVMFAGANSIWIYLWHIFMVQWWHALSWGLEYLVICSLATAVTWVQVKLVQRFLLANVQDKRWQKNWRGLLTG